MTTRRDFIAKSAASGLVLVASTQCTHAGAIDQTGKNISAAYPGEKHLQVKGLVRRDDTILRFGPAGSGYAFPMTWMADDRQLLVVIDGAGFSRPARKFYHSRVFTASGDPPNLAFEDVIGYPDMLMRLKESESASFWGGGCFALDGYIYQFLTTSNHPYLKPDTSFWPDFYWVGSKVIYSPDNGVTWHNQDGSSPVLWEKWGARSRNNMVFFNEEPAGAFAWLSVLQMGENYALNKDGFVYVYSPNGYADGSVNELVMFRVPKSRILDRHSYEFFSGVGPHGGATWTSDISARAVVHTFPKGWVNRYVPGESPWAWVPSVTYNAPLGVYMMASWGTSCTPDGGWFAKPSYLGLWIASTPWGPFTQIHEDSAWTPGNAPDARAFMPQIPPKWISADGKSFWLVWSDYQYKGGEGEAENPDQGFFDDVKNIADEAEVARVVTQWTEKHMPRSSLNMQRIDIVLR